MLLLLLALLPFLLQHHVDVKQYRRRGRAAAAAAAETNTSRRSGIVSGDFICLSAGHDIRVQERAACGEHARLRRRSSGIQEAEGERTHDGGPAKHGFHGAAASTAELQHAALVGVVAMQGRATRNMRANPCAMGAQDAIERARKGVQAVCGQVWHGLGHVPNSAGL